MIEINNVNSINNILPFEKQDENIIFETASEDEAKPWLGDLADDAYYGIAGEFVKAIMPYTEADPAGILLDLITTISVYISKKAYIQNGAEKIYVNIFNLVTGDTGARKGTGWKIVKELFNRLDENFVNDHIKSGFSSGEGIIARISDKLYNPDTKEYEDNLDQRLLIREDEFSSILKVAGREGNILSQIIMQGFDSSPLEINVKDKKRSLRSSHPHIGLIADITPQELKNLTKNLYFYNGFLNRFLFTCVRRYKVDPCIPPVPDSIYNNTVLKLKDVINWLAELKIVRFEIADSIKDLWSNIYHTIPEEIKDPILAGLTSRAEPYILKLCVIYALLDKTEKIRYEHLKAALAIWERNVNSIKYLFNLDSQSKEYNYIKAKIINALALGPLTQTEISRSIFKGNVSSKKIKYVLEKLSESGKIKCIKQSTKGRSKLLWSLNK
jgi:hypothetical protein